MAKRLHVSGAGSTRVPSGAEYIGQLKLIKAKKGASSNWPNELFQHKFTRKNEMYRVSMRVPAGSTKIYDRAEEAKLAKGSIKFSSGKIYGLKNGNVMLVTSKGTFLVVGNQPLWDVFDYPER